MQVASLLLSPLIMSGADFLFSSIRGDAYTEETRRHNKVMEKLETQRSEWEQKYAEEQEKRQRRREEKRDAVQDREVDRAVLDNLLEQRENMRVRLRDETRVRQVNNPYYAISDVVITGAIVYGSYKMYKSLRRSESSESSE